MSFRPIPIAPGYLVDECGTVVCQNTLLALPQSILGKYLIVTILENGCEKTLRVNRAVASAWVYNPDPAKFTIVNHLDGNTLNNYPENLEWTDYSGNNYHAVNSGLRTDPIGCKIRNYYTKEILTFPSMAQAAEHMGLRKDTSIHSLYPKQFGKLIQGQWEFRFSNDTTPWFYETRELLDKPARYLVTHIDPEGNQRELYSNRTILQELQLYDAPNKSVPGLIEYARVLYPTHQFDVRDAYLDDRYREFKSAELPRQKSVTGYNYITTQAMEFKSLTEAANHFNIDRSVIQLRLKTGLPWGDWIFTENG